jgi:large subunit ribosomal protein L18|tara:strand:- start:256 stop:495 length:240 start_codon:yes stop_codon:yes gene_type:complete
VIDGNGEKTLAAASTNEKQFKSMDIYSGNQEAAKKIGEIIAERAKTSGISEVVFDRSGYRFHGRVKALAEAAREAGLKF